MPAASRRRSGKAEEEPICGHIGDDDNAAGRRLDVVGAARYMGDAP
jgi:hypothetical protein